MKPRFITVEGIDGSGKSTFIEALAQKLRTEGVPLVSLREPGSTEIGEEIRALVRKSRQPTCHAETEMLLFFAARCQLLHEKIQPALKRGFWVLCDRYIDSTYAYQVCGGGADEALFDALIQQLRLPMPDCTLLLDVTPEQSRQRVAQRHHCAPTKEHSGSSDSFEERSDEFVTAVRQGFLTRAERDPKRILVLDTDAALSEQEINRQVTECVDTLAAQWRTSRDDK